MEYKPPTPLERAVREAENEVHKEEVLTGKKEVAETPDDDVPVLELSPDEDVSLEQAVREAAEAQE